MDTSNKRMQQDLEAVQAEHQYVKSMNEKLTAENSEIQRELEQEAKDKDKRAQEHSALSELLATAEKRAEEADTRAQLRFANDQKQHAAQIHEWEAKSAKAEAERDQEKATSENYKNKLDTMAADLVKKEKDMADMVEKERVRADEAEATLASVRALLGKTV
jgi:hypothetical protein